LDFKTLKHKLTRKKKIILATVCTGAGIVLILPAAIAFLLTRTPAYYKPLEPPNKAEVSPYLTNYLAPEIHNKSQLGEPFELVITQAGLNDIIARGPWPLAPGGVTITRPAVRLSQNRIFLMATVKYGRVPAVITIIVSPALDEAGLLSINLKQVNAGVFDITNFAKELAEEIITAGISKIDSTLADNIIAAVLENKPFDPVFPAYDNEVRLTGIDISDSKAVLQLTPQSQR